MKPGRPDGGRGIQLFDKETSNSLLRYDEKPAKESHPVSKSYNF